MQNLIAENILTMSSREIADLTEKLHKNVKRDIERMLTDLGEDTLTFEHIWLDSLNRQQTEYLLDHDHTICLLTGYSAIHRMRVIRRWQELEEQSVKYAIPQTYPDALQLAAELAEDNQKLTAVNQQQQAEIHDLRNLFKEGMTATQFCKMLNGVNTQQVNRVEILDISVASVLDKLREIHAGSEFVMGGRTGNALSKAFRQARELSGLIWKRKPPPFHELRSLSGRLYARQRGKDFAQNILGHKSAQMTEKYTDGRGKEWIDV